MKGQPGIPGGGKENIMPQSQPGENQTWKTL